MLIQRFASFTTTVIVLLGLMLGLGQGVALAQEPSKTPMLRIETGMHNAAIMTAAVDPANRFMVTVSVDKTLRIWELRSGTLIRVIRPPIGVGIAGQLYALAISPDGNSIACGGDTAERPEDESIYIIDRSSGSIIRRIQPSSEVIGLVYSKDGSLLSASLSKNGIRLYETQTYRLVDEDKQYGGAGYGARSADFTANGKLITSSGDGYIRLYDVRNGLQLIAKKKGKGDKLPADIRVSPDGDKIAVGFYSGQVSVLSATDLSLLYSPDTNRVIHPNLVPCLLAVAWSADGSELFAAGRFAVAGRSLIRKWAGSGRGPYKDLQASRGVTEVRSIVSLKDGGIAFATIEPAFGVLNVDGAKRFFIGPEDTDNIVDLESIKSFLEGFRVSTDAKIIEFGVKHSTVRFSLADKRLEQSPAPLDSLRPPLTQSPGLSVTDWFLKNYPKLDGKLLKIDDGTVTLSVSLSIAPDKNHFLLSTTQSLILFDRNGVQRWILPSGGGGSVNISGDGRFAVASQTDRTIRWYRMTDGKELLALFPHADRKRWVLWTPSGYYDASPGGDELIGWHVNNGADQTADFFPVGQFRSTFYRPDVTAKVLETLDETVALRLANEESGRKQPQVDLSQRLPPVVEIASPTDGAETTAPEITVRFRVRTPSGEPVTGIKALVDGRPVSGGRGLKHSGQASDIQELKVTVPEQDSEISLLAENKYAMSVPATVRVRWRGATASKDEFTIKPKLYVLAVGVSKYANKDLTLGFAAKDASDFVATMERQKGGLYRDVVVKLLTDENATKDEVLDGLDWIRKETTSKDVAMVFMAGHGVNDQNGFYFFCPYNLDPEKILRTGVPFSDIKNTVSSLAGKTLFFVDTCHSGNVMGTRRALVDVTGIVNELASAENGAVVFAASTGNQYSLENVEWGNGAFTKALVEGLSGRADYGGRGKITINMIDLYLSERVKELTKGKQTPTTTKPQTIQDFPIAVKQ